jgi:thioredoxin 1
MQRFTKEKLEYAVNGAGPVVAAFSADWCSSSLSLAAALKQIGQALGDDRVTVGMVQVDEDPRVPARYDVRGLPTTMLFKNGAIVATRVGGLTNRQLQDWVYDHV